MDQKKTKKNDQQESLKQQVEEYKDKYLRALADYHNLEKRVVAEKQEIRNSAEEILVKRLLPVIDALKKAKEHFKDEGIRLIHNQLHAALEASGFARIPAPVPNVDLYNPETMECVEVVEGKKDRVILEEVLPGYTLRGKILRPMQVKISKIRN